jgi:histidyl-tRNA synthetase
MLVGERTPEPLDIAVIPIDAQAQSMARTILTDLRDWSLSADMDFRGNMKKRMQRANASNAAMAIIIGPDELAKNVVICRNLATGEQFELPLGEGLVSMVEAELWAMGRAGGGDTLLYDPVTGETRELTTVRDK